MGVKINGKYIGELRNELVHQTGEKIFTDAPLDNHGKGEAFSPTDLIAAGLGSCMITILAIRANSKKINIDKPTFSIIKNMQSNPRKIQKISIEICLSDSVAKKEREYLETEAKNCPVALCLNPSIIQNIVFKYV